MYSADLGKPYQEKSCFILKKKIKRGGGLQPESKNVEVVFWGAFFWASCGRRGEVGSFEVVFDIQEGQGG